MKTKMASILLTGDNRGSYWVMALLQGGYCEIRLADIACYKTVTSPSQACNNGGV